MSAAASEPRTWDLVCRRSVRRRATLIAAIVGCVLAMINHGDRIILGGMTSVDWVKVALTFLVPYTVSTISSVLALREQHKLIAQLRGASGSTTTS